MKITKYNFIIPITTDSGEELKVYVPHPNDVEISRISRVLSYFYKETQSNSIITCIVDYERLIDEALMDVTTEYSNNIKKAIETFFNRVELSAKLSDGRDYHTMSDGEKEEFKSVFRGTLLFICALWRYSFMNLETEGENEIMQDIKQFFTLQDVTAWINSLQKPSAESQAKAIETTQSNVADVKVSQILS